jgi:hypothetical protein
MSDKFEMDIPAVAPHPLESRDTTSLQTSFDMSAYHKGNTKREFSFIISLFPYLDVYRTKRLVNTGRLPNNQSSVIDNGI